MARRMVRGDDGSLRFETYETEEERQSRDDLAFVRRYVARTDLVPIPGEEQRLLSLIAQRVFPELFDDT